jgi:hypothetical protein
MGNQCLKSEAILQPSPLVARLCDPSPATQSPASSDDENDSHNSQYQHEVCDENGSHSPHPRAGAHPSLPPSADAVNPLNRNASVLSDGVCLPPAVGGEHDVDSMIGGSSGRGYRPVGPAMRGSTLSYQGSSSAMSGEQWSGRRRSARIVQFTRVHPNQPSMTSFYVGAPDELTPATSPARQPTRRPDGDPLLALVGFFSNTSAGDALTPSLKHAGGHSSTQQHASSLSSFFLPAAVADVAAVTDGAVGSLSRNPLSLSLSTEDHHRNFIPVASGPTLDSAVFGVDQLTSGGWSSVSPSATHAASLTMGLPLFSQ